MGKERFNLGVEPLFIMGERAMSYARLRSTLRTLLAATGVPNRNVGWAFWVSWLPHWGSAGADTSRETRPLHHGNGEMEA